MTYPLQPLSTQLDNGTATAGNDCSVESLRNAFLTVSHGRVGGHTDLQHRTWVHMIRNAAGEQHDGLLLHTQTYRAYRALLPQFDHAGLKRPHIEFAADVGWGTIIRRMWAGWIVHLAIDYGVLNHQGHAPSGSLDFQGGHSIVMANPRKTHNGRVYVNVADSLMDGRLRWVSRGGHQVLHKYPRGWQLTRMYDYRDPAGKWGELPGGPGRAFAIFVKENR